VQRVLLETRLSESDRRIVSANVDSRYGRRVLVKTHRYSERRSAYDFPPTDGFATLLAFAEECGTGERTVTIGSGAIGSSRRSALRVHVKQDPNGNGRIEVQCCRPDGTPFGRTETLGSREIAAMAAACESLRSEASHAAE
jgi:hypothetical protein